MKAVQCRMARAALQIGVRELAEMARVSTSTISKLERGESLMSRTAEAVQRALEARGIEFLDSPPGVRLRDLPLNSCRRHHGEIKARETAQG
jgi:transcriptional regulator with XRE-family HTH domain